MSTAVTITYSPNGHRGIVVAQWAALANGETGDSVELSAWADRSIQIEGTFGAGGSAQLEGSNDGTAWQLLTDPQGNDIIKTSADLEQVSEITRYVRARCTAGDGTTALRITFLARKT